MNIIIIVDHASITGGQAKVALSSAIGLKRAGHNPIIFSAAGPVEPTVAEAGIEVHCLGQHDLMGNPSKAAAAVQGIWNRRATRALSDLLSAYSKEDTIIHVHGWAKALSPAISTPIIKSGIASIYTMHEYFLYCPNGAFYNYTTGSNCHIPPQSLNCLATNCDSRNYLDKIWRFSRGFTSKNVFDLPGAFSAIILFSEFQRSIVENHISGDQDIFVIPNPIDMDDLGKKENPAAGDFIFVGRLSREKGVFCFAEAARLAGVQATFIGDGPISSALQERYPESRILGWQPPDVVKKHMRDARALVFPSLWYEGQPLTTLEAKALGTPVIVADGCAARDFVEDGESGLWFKSGDANSLAEAIEKLKNDEDVVRMSHASHENYWRSPPTIGRHIENLLGAYDEILSN